MLKTILANIGLTEKEIEVYMTLVQQKRLTPSGVAKATGLNRSTVYSIAKGLMRKDLLAEDYSKKQTYLSALPPQNLNNLIKKEERELKEKKDLIGNAISELEAITANTGFSIPKINFVYEEDLLDYLYKNSETWNESCLKYDGIWWGFQDHTFVQNYEEWVDWFWAKFAPKEVMLKMLSNQSETEQKMRTKGYTRRMIRSWNGGKDLTSSTWINGDYIIMITTKQRPHYLVQIHDKTLAHNMREMFKSIWENQQK